MIRQKSRGAHIRLAAGAVFFEPAADLLPSRGQRILDQRENLGPHILRQRLVAETRIEHRGKPGDVYDVALL